METETNIIDELSDQATTLAERDAMDPLTADDLCLLWTRIDGAMKRLKEAKGELEKFLIDYLPTHCRELVIGDTRYFVTTKKKTKCLSIPEAVTALYEATGGDFDAFCDCLSSNAIKYGAAKKVLGDRFQEHFDVIEELDLEGKPVKELASLNPKFIK